MTKGGNRVRSSLGACIVCAIIRCSGAFAPPSSSATTKIPRSHLAATGTPLELTNNPSPSQVAELASTPSRRESRSGTWSETISAGEARTRYIVEGEGSLTLTSADGETTRQRIKPGSLVKVEGVEGESQMVWDVDDEMTILYSGEMFDEQQQVAIGLLGLLAAAGGLAYLAQMQEIV